MSGETATEESLAEDIGAIMSGHSSAPTAVMTPAVPTVRYEFDDDFQSKIAAMVLRETRFNERTDGLIKPGYFESASEAVLVNIALKYFSKYKQVPDTVTLMRLLAGEIEAKRVRKDMVPEIKATIKKLYKEVDISDVDFVVDETAAFARTQAVSQAILDAAELIIKRKVDEALELVKRAGETGAHDTGLASYDYFQRIEERTQTRKDKITGVAKPTGITTGSIKFDRLLYHKGWGRKELTVVMGGPKAGKSTALGHFGRMAAFAGYNVLIVTLEVSAQIYAERLDAAISDVGMDELATKIMEVERKVKDGATRAAKLVIEEFPTGSLSPPMLKRLLNRYKANGTVFDMVVLDYADLMAPEFRTDSPIENSRSIYVALRAIAQEWDLALLTATQTNREGAKAGVAKMDHVAEDFNRIRIADLVFSINRTEDDARNNEARLYFVASRNQKGGMQVTIKQDTDKMVFINEIVRIE